MTRARTSSFEPRFNERMSGAVFFSGFKTDDGPQIVRIGPNEDFRKPNRSAKGGPGHQLRFAVVTTVCGGSRRNLAARARWKR